MRVGKEHARKHLQNCEEYLGLGTDDLETEEPADLSVFLHQAASCQALRWLEQAHPSARSFLDGFRLDAQATRTLPARFYLDLAPEEEAALAAATRKSQSWRSFDAAVRADARADARAPAHFTGNGYDAYLREFARGDFDRDGVEDILIARLAYPSGGSMTDYALFLLTRTADDLAMPATDNHRPRVLRVLKVWRQAG